MGCTKKGIKIPHISAFEIIVVVAILYHIKGRKSIIFKSLTENFGKSFEG